MLINFNLIDREGKKISIEAEKGTTIREAVMDKLAPGNFGLCGGANICATCHVYVDEKYFPKLTSANEDEVETMQTNDIDQTEFSRLSCQIELHEEIKDITVTMEKSRRREVF
jgi:2Fe-2S ferredoxin